MYTFINCPHPLSRTTIAICLALCAVNRGYAAESIEFDETFLMGDGKSSIDISRYADGNPTPPGVYNVSVFVNDKITTNLEIPFIDVGKNDAEACISKKNLAQLHINQPEKIKNSDILLKKEDENSDCLNLTTLIDNSNISYDSSDQRLYITVPQAWQNRSYQGYVDPSLWDNGINAATLSYSLNAYHSEYDNGNNDTFYGAFNSGVNLAGWRFRATGNYNWAKNGGSNLDFQNRYVQRDITALRSQLIMGEAYTTGETFDSVNIRGARLYSDSRMLPSSQASYAPIIRGVANSNARVTITQGGYKIYETTVPPGAFIIDDLSPSGFGSDLIVTIEEADGSRRTFSQPFSSVMQMQRPGVARWDFSIGQMKDDSLRHEPNLIQGSFYYGINNYVTGYAGLQVTDNDYSAGLLGVGINTPFGAIAVDVTQSQAEITDDESYAGQSYRLTWNKLLEPTETSINVAAYRYSTRKYLGLSDAQRLIDDAAHGVVSTKMNTYERLKNQFTVSISQPLQFEKEDYGSFYLSGSWSDYWAGEHSRSEYNVGYSKGFSWGSAGITVQRTWNEYGNKDDAMYINFSIPLSNLFGGTYRRSGFTSLNANINTDFNGTHMVNMNSSGNSEDNLLNYSVNTGYTMNKTGSDLASVGGYASYDSQWGSWSASSSFDTDKSRQYSLSTDGGFVLHSGGLTFSNDSFSSSDTIVLVKAPGAKGARINSSGSSVDRWGYGVTSSLSPYRENTISLDIEDMDGDVELKSTSTIAVPRDGAILFANFETDQGRSAIINMSRSDNKTLPFAAEVYEGDASIGNMGQDGQAFVRGINNAGELIVRWYEEGRPQSCRAAYQFPAQPATLPGSQTLVLSNVICRISNRN
ncbi:outer membrane usher protein [Salmonella enterica subsp. enterica serovar Derby]|nr:outer membrane usher protein [Salmonella enterica subsp. enterica serovar Derby]ECV4172776.1 outer membrane usher protein [Salmonella enterica subsp. enterica serovar Derby]